MTNELVSKSISPNEAAKHAIRISMDGVKRNALQVLALKDVDMQKIRSVWPDLTQNGQLIDRQVEIDAHYSGYLSRQENDIASFKKDENILIPADLDYDCFSSLSNEVKSKLKLIKPRTLGQALRIDGITPAAAILLLGFIKRSKKIKHKYSA